MERSKAMKTADENKANLNDFQSVQLEAVQTTNVKGGNGGEEEGDANGVVGEVDIIDL